MSATKRPSAIGLHRGVGTVQAEADAAAIVEGSTPAQQRIREALQPPRPEKPVRFTLDLDQERHAFLKRFALECGAGVGGAQVLRALLDELREGANLPVRVRARIWAENK